MFQRRYWPSAALLFLAACSRGATPPLAEDQLPVSGGDSLHYRLIGRGTDTVVILHGGPALNSRYMEEALRPLAESHVLLFYDMRGRGRSSDAHAADSLSLDQDLADLQAVQAHFALGPLRLIGHHWGAALAAQYAIRHPGQVARMGLLSPMPQQASFTFRLAHLPNDSTAVGDWTAARASHADSLDPAGFCGRFWGFQFSPAEITAPAVVRRLAPAVCDDSPRRIREREVTTRQLYLSLRRWDWADSLGLASPPALVVVGGESAAWLGNAEQWSSRLHDARLLVLGRTALFPWAEANRDVNHQLDLFLRGGWPEKAARVDSTGKLITNS